MAVIDASVYVALINEKEEHHAKSWSWFVGTQASQESIIAPAILLAEVASALSWALATLSWLTAWSRILNALVLLNELQYRYLWPN